MAVPPTNTQGGVGKKKNMRGQNEAVKQPLAILQKGGIESARMPGDSSVCVGRLGD